MEKIFMVFSFCVTVLYAVLLDDYKERGREIEYLKSQLTITNARLLDCRENTNE